MGYARIVSGGEDGLYTIEVDTGEAFRVAILNALLLKYVDVSAKIIQQEAAVAAADAAEAEMRVSITAFANSIAAFQLSAGTDLGSLTGLTTIYSTFLMMFRKAQAKNAPLRTTLETLKRIQVETARKRTSIENVLALRTQKAWCCDLTTNRAAGSYVATVDIPGESNLILIAPGARAPISGDGKIPQARKDANLAPLLAQLDTLLAEKAQIDDKITIAKSEETVLKAAQAVAQAAYKADPSKETATALITATERLNKKKSDIVALQMSLHVVDLRIYGVQEKITYWSNRPAAEKPIYGDGHLYERALMSPEQSFVNVAILPGWQKYKPTYRWGTLTSINTTANTGNVTLFDSTSSAQRLDVNQASSLSAVPFEYMECHNVAFKVGDKVVVKFADQDWAKPSIIGFLDNPKGCQWIIVGTSSPFVSIQVEPFFCTDSQDITDTIWAAAKTEAIVVEMRENRGPWTAIPLYRVLLDPPFNFSIDDLNPIVYQLQTVWQAYIDYVGVPQYKVKTWNVSFYNVKLPTMPTFPTEGPLPSDIRMAITLQAGPHEMPANYIDPISPAPGTVVGPAQRTFYPYEARLSIGGTVVFNGAVSEAGWAEDGLTGNKAKSRSGIENQWGYTCSPLDYVLGGE